MAQAIDNIQSYTAGMDGTSFKADRKTQDAVIRQLEIMGKESAVVGTDAVRLQHPSAGTRRTAASGLKSPILPLPAVGSRGASHFHAMLTNLTPFLLHWAITAVSLWVASHLFKGIRFGSTGALVVSALLLGLANAVVRPLLVLLTLPLTLITFGLFLLVILVAKLVDGFKVDGFWTALWASMFIALLSLVLGAFVLGGSPDFTIETGPGQVWL